jgi:hypothetical protein
MKEHGRKCSWPILGYSLGIGLERLVKILTTAKVCSQDVAIGFYATPVSSTFYMHVSCPSYLLLDLLQFS